MKRYLLITLLCSACAGSSSEYTIFDGPPNGGNYSGLYLQGWRDGCETGAASSADNIYKYRRIFKQDWQLAQNDEYHQGWKQAYTYCRKKVLAENSK